MSWIVCQREEGNPNDMYTAGIKTDAMKTVQIKRFVYFLVVFHHRFRPS